MYKKLFGGASLLIIVMTFLVITNSAYSDENREDWYQTTINYVCLSGEIAYSSTKWVVDKWYDNHPADSCWWSEDCTYWFNWDTLQSEEYCWPVYKCNHTSHWITYRVYEDYKTIRRSATPNRCRRFR